MNENRSKMVLMSIAIVAIGIFTLPIAVSLFSAQHTWYDLSAGANDVPCEKCHAEIADEMQSSDNGVHRRLDLRDVPQNDIYKLYLWKWLR